MSRFTRYGAVMMTAVLAGAAVAACSDNGTGPAARPVERSIVAERSDTAKGVVGTALDSPLVVRVLDANGAPVAGEPVTFTIYGHGVLNPAMTSTDANGFAMSHFTFGTVAQDLRITVSTDSIKEGATFLLQALTGPAENLLIAQGDSQAGAAGSQLTLPLVVEVTDRYGNPVPGVTVTWSSNAGSLTLLSSTSDAHGLARTNYTLDATPGLYTVTAAIANGASVDFTLTDN